MEAELLTHMHPVSAYCVCADIVADRLQAAFSDSALARRARDDHGVDSTLFFRTLDELRTDLETSPSSHFESDQVCVCV